MSRTKKTLICILVGFALAAILMLLFQAFNAEDTVLMYRRICDSFFVSGGLLFSVGVLTLCSNEGTFDMLFYGLKKVGYFFIPIRRKGKVEKSFPEYKEERMEKIKPFIHLILGGIVNIIIAIIFLIVYLNVSS